MSEAEAALMAERIRHEWLRGEVLQVLAPGGQVDQARYQVRGLDGWGASLGDTAAQRATNWFLDSFDDAAAGFVAVRGDDPRCAAVGLYRGVGFDHAWLVVTSHRFAVLRLRDVQNTEEGKVAELVDQTIKERSLGAKVRGLGRIVKTSATEFVKTSRRAPLVERPRDAILTACLELPRDAVVSVSRWKQPMVPEFDGGPRFVEVRFTDSSWARVRTTRAGLLALTGAG